MYGNCLPRLSPYRSISRYGDRNVGVGRGKGDAMKGFDFLEMRSDGESYSIMEDSCEIFYVLIRRWVKRFWLNVNQPNSIIK